MSPTPDGSRATPDTNVSASADATGSSSASVATTVARRMHRSSITVRMVLLIVLVVGVTTASIGTLAYTRARDALEEAARARLELLALGMARNLHGELVERVADITTWARLEAMLALTFADVDKELADFMRHTVSGRQAYRALAGFDHAGRRVAVAGDDAVVPLTQQSTPATRLRVVAAGVG